MWNSSDSAGASAAGASTYGERLLRGTEAAVQADAVEAEVRQQLDAALHGPLGMALAAPGGPASAAIASDMPGASQAGRSGDAEQAGQLLSTEVPRRFIAAGACLSAAYAALAAGDEARVAGALLCAQRFLFPHDVAGATAVAHAVAAATRELPAPNESPQGLTQAEAMQQSVAATAEALERAYLAAAGHLSTAALSARSWLSATGGMGPGSVAGQTQFGPFLEGLVRWAFYVEAALQGVRADDWARTGAALVGARRFVSQRD